MVEAPGVLPDEVAGCTTSPSGRSAGSTAGSESGIRGVPPGRVPWPGPRPRRPGQRARSRSPTLPASFARNAVSLSGWSGPPALRGTAPSSTVPSAIRTTTRPGASAATPGKCLTRTSTRWRARAPRAGPAPRRCRSRRRPGRRRAAQRRSTAARTWRRRRCAARPCRPGLAHDVGAVGVHLGGDAGHLAGSIGSSLRRASRAECMSWHDGYGLIVIRVVSHRSPSPSTMSPARPGVGQRGVEPPLALEHGRRPVRAGGREACGDDAGLRGQTGVQLLGRGAGGQELQQPGGLAAGDAERVDGGGDVEPHQPSGDQGRGEDAADRGRVQAAGVEGVRRGHRRSGRRSRSRRRRRPGTRRRSRRPARRRRARRAARPRSRARGRRRGCRRSRGRARACRWPSRRPARRPGAPSAEDASPRAGRRARRRPSAPARPHPTGRPRRPSRHRRAGAATAASTTGSGTVVTRPGPRAQSAQGHAVAVGDHRRHLPSRVATSSAVVARASLPDVVEVLVALGGAAVRRPRGRRRAPARRPGVTVPKRGCSVSSDQVAGLGVRLGQRRGDVVDRPARDRGGRSGSSHSSTVRVTKISSSSGMSTSRLHVAVGEGVRSAGRRPLRRARARSTSRCQNFSLAQPTTIHPSLASKAWNGTSDGCAECRVRTGS